MLNGTAVVRPVTRRASSETANTAVVHRNPMTETGDENRQEAKLRRVGYGIVLAGVLAVLVDLVSAHPPPIVTYGFGGLAVAVFVLESLQSEPSGLGIGLLVGSLGGWVWPEIGGGSYRVSRRKPTASVVGGRQTVLGVTLVVVGFVNAATTPYFRRLGERLAGR